METDVMCCIQDDCQTETDTRYCLELLFQTDTRLPNRYSFAKQIYVCFGACALVWYKRELIRPQIPALGLISLTRTYV